MIQSRSILKVADNSGAQTIRCIQIKGGSYHKYGIIGDIVIGSVQSAKPRKTVKKKDVVKAVVVRQRKSFKRSNGSHIRFDDNAVIIVDDKFIPVGTRVFGPIAREIKTCEKYPKIIELGPELV
jgi:large subunit ribosomal protein L14